MKKPINPIFPVAEVGTVDQLMDIATAMEREAARRYEDLATQMDRYGNAGLAVLFRQLADDERRHEEQIAGWAVREGGRTPQPAAFQWRMPETFDLSETGASGYSLTPYRALRIALHNEEQAFSFYTYLAAAAGKDEVRERAEALAKGELDHIARLRVLSSEAAERHGRRRRLRVASLDGLYRVSLGLERSSAWLYAALAQILDTIGDAVSASLLHRIAEEERASVDSLTKKSGIGTETAEAAKAAGILEPRSLTALGAVRLSLKNAEEVLQTYLDIAKRTKDEAILNEAQRLGEQAVARLALISSRLQQLSG